jgi:hypothetical protein
MKKVMMFFGLLLAMVLINPERDLFATSAAIKSQNDYVMMLTMIREMRIMVENFGTDDQKKKFDDIKALFKKSAERHYAQEFIKPDTLTEDTKPDSNAQSSLELFLQLKSKVADLFDEISKNYIDRTQLILDSTSKEANDVLIEYGKNTGLAKFFYKAIDPVSEKKPYDASKYHYYRDKETLERYLKHGYRMLQEARNLFNGPDFVYIKAKKEKDTDDFNFLLKTHMDIIKLCRQSKLYGFEMHRILKLSSLGAIQTKYNVSFGEIEHNPLYDDRIPEEYKVDALDSLKLEYRIEKDRIGYTASK